MGGPELLHSVELDVGERRFDHLRPDFHDAGLNGTDVAGPARRAQALRHQSERVIDNMQPQSTSTRALPREADYVIVGAGHNGLTAACYLAKAGHSVAVLERLQPSVE